MTRTTGYNSSLAKCELSAKINGNYPIELF